MVREPMKTNFRILLSAISAVCACGHALAQQIDTPKHPSNSERLAIIRDTAVKADVFLKRARAALRENRFSEVEENCERATYILQSTPGSFDASVHGLLAESLTAQKRYREAIVEIRRMESNQGPRSRMTHAIALAGLGQRNEASKLIFDEAGTQDAPTSIRTAKMASVLPIDKSRSPDALIASALVIRAVCVETQAEDRLQDLKEAAKLFPQDSTIELLVGFAHYRLSQFDEAIPHFDTTIRIGADKQVELAKRYRRDSLTLKSMKRG